MRHSYDFGTSFKILVAGLILVALCALPLLPFLPLRPPAVDHLFFQNDVEEEPLPESALLRGGISPDGKYEVRLDVGIVSPDGKQVFRAIDAPDSDYSFIVVNKTDLGKSSFPYMRSGYDCKFSKKYAHVLWKQDSSLFAVVDAVDQYSIEMRIFFLDGEEWTEMGEKFRLSNYFHNAMGRAGNTQASLYHVTEPVSWGEDSLKCTIIFDVIPKIEGCSFCACDFTLKIEPGKYGTPPEYYLESMSKATPLPFLHIED